MVIDLCCLLFVFWLVDGMLFAPLLPGRMAGVGVSEYLRGFVGVLVNYGQFRTDFGVERTLGGLIDSEELESL